MIHHSTVAVFAILCIANVACHCSTSTYITTSTTVSPAHRRGSYRCHIYTHFFTSPPDTTLTIDCPVFDVTCFFRGGNWFRVQREKRVCGLDFTPVVTKFNYIEVQYRQVRSPWANLDFQCNVKVDYPAGMFSSSCDCRYPTAPPLITAGVIENEPYYVSIPQFGDNACVGTLLSDQWVLTSAACNVQISSAVEIGSQNSDKDSSKREIAEVIKHPQYYGWNYRYDIALVHLDEPVPLSDHISPICLPFHLLTTSLAGKTAIGYRNLDGAQAKIIENVELNIISNEQCSKYLGYQQHDDSICTNNERKDDCNYGAAMPLVYFENGFGYLIGMSSFGHGCAKAGMPAVHIRIANPALLHWITTTIDFKCTQAPQSSTIPPEIDSSKCDICGTRKSGFHTRIVGGEDADPGEFPYQVSISEFGYHFCGGSLISKDWVVSAAHCEIHPRWHKIVLGEHSLNKKSNEEITARIQTVINHPKYNDTSAHFDIAVVKLQDEVTFTDYIQPICLPDNFKPEDFYGKFVEVSGWGSLEYEDYDSAEILQQATLDVISHEQCKKVFGDELFEENICTFSVGKDACQGDSGGPLAYHYEGRFYLIGVTSWGIGCAHPDYPGVYSSMAHPHMLNWVKKNAGIDCQSTPQVQPARPTQDIPTETCECGKRKAGLFNRIVGGKVADKGEFPFQVSLAYADYHYCGGSLISNQWVVTAAHCNVHTNTDYVVLGEHNVEEKTGNEVYRSIDSFLRHPSFTNASRRFDIALLKLESAVKFTAYIQPICLPDKFTSAYFEGKSAQATGWGSLKYRRQDSESAIELNKVTLDVITYDQCKNKLQEQLFEENMCTSTPGKDACQGDSGGPLSYQQDSVLYLIGVVSWGIECAHPDYPGVFTSITNPTILSWVKENSNMECVAP